MDLGYELLGRRESDDTQRELRWRHVLRLAEMSWPRGYEVRGEVFLLGAAYIPLTVKAGRRLEKATWDATFC
jgi:NAD-dependent DNA ligase